jgi:hypothetical protein
MKFKFKFKGSERGLDGSIAVKRTQHECIRGGWKRAVGREPAELAQGAVRYRQQAVLLPVQRGGGESLPHLLEELENIADARCGGAHSVPRLLHGHTLTVAFGVGCVKGLSCAWSHAFKRGIKCIYNGQNE